MIELKVEHVKGDTELLSFNMLSVEEVPIKYIELKEIGDICCYGCEQNNVIEIIEKDSRHGHEETTRLRIGERVSTKWFKEAFLPLLKMSGKRLTEINKTTIETIHI